MNRIIVTSSVLLIIGCASEPTSTGEAIKLFDTEAYISKEFDGRIQRNVIKTISYNEAEEVIEIKDYNLENDLEILNQTNINKPSWADKYMADTLQLNNTRTDIVYTAVDPKLQIMELIVFKENDQVIGFEAYLERDALISSSSKIISYTANKGYKISTTSKNLISRERTIAINVRF